MGCNIIMPYRFLDGFQETGTHSRIHDDCHVSIFGSGRDNCYVLFGHEHQLDSARVSKKLSPKQFSFEATPLLSLIGDFLIQSNLLTPLEILDV